MRLQRADAVLQLPHDIPQADQVFFRLHKLALRFGFAVAETGDPGSLLEDFPALGAFNADDLGDLALLDDRIAVAAQTGIHKGLVNILEPDQIVIDAVFAFSAAVKAAGKDYLVCVNIDAAVGIIDKKADPGKTGRFAGNGAAEDNVLHLGAAQTLDRLFAEYPFDGVADVAFAAAVGAYDNGDAVIEGQLGAVGERFEPLHLYRL